MGANETKIQEAARWIEATEAYLESINVYVKDNIQPRRYRGDELKELVGVSVSTIYTAEKEGRVPPPDTDERGRRLGSTIGQVIALQDYFGTRPGRKDGDDVQIISFTNFKGGCYKSTTSIYAGSYYANQGYRVLLVDLDPQSTITQACGLFPDRDTDYETSMAPFITEDDQFPLEGINKVVRKTYLPNMDIIPSCLELAGAEIVLNAQATEARIAGDSQELASIFYRVRKVLDQVKDNYDLVIVDGTPSLGLIPINIILAADTVVVPVPTEAVDFQSTRAFAKLYKQQAEILVRTYGDNITLPEMYILPTRYSPSETNASVSSTEILEAVRRIFGRRCLDAVIRKHESVVSNLSFFRRTVFDVNAGDCNVRRDARDRAIANFSEVFNEILHKAVFTRWPSKRAQLAERGLV